MSTLDTLQKLLPIKSNPGREQDMFDAVKEMFVSLGFKQVPLPLFTVNYQVHRSVANTNGTFFQRKTPNLGLHFQGASNQPHYLFNAHLDHYFTEEITRKPVLSENWLSSDGKNILSADCKAGIALIFQFVALLLQKETPPSIDLLFDTCEEDGLIGITEFVQEKHYHLMPFWESYKKNRPVYSYSFDGEGFFDAMSFYVNKPTSIFLCKYLMASKPRPAEILDVVKGAIKLRKLKKSEKTLLATVQHDSLEVSQIRMLKFGASFVILNKIIPTVLIPIGVVAQHTSAERIYLPWLKTVESWFHQFVRN